MKTSHPLSSDPVASWIRMVRPGTLVVVVVGAVIVPVASALVMSRSFILSPYALTLRALLSLTFTVSPASSTVSSMSAKPICTVVSPAGMTWV